MNQFLKTVPEIESWLQNQKIKNYELVINENNSDIVVNVSGDVSLAMKKLSRIPVKFGVVSGYFYCYDNDLTSLENCPYKVGGDFYCDRNKLTSLQFCPESVGGIFSCSNNLIENLKHAPQNVHESFYCDENLLTSLEFCPDTVKKYFICNDNDLSSLEFCPSSVGRDFKCHHNPGLGATQDIKKFQEIYKIHQNFLNIKSEKESLSQTIKVNGHENKQRHKI